MLPFILMLMPVICTGNDPSIEELLKFYTNVINSGQEGAENYVFPFDATEFEGDESEVHEYGTHDYVIVGAGAAGTVLARRLVEHNNFKVLLLEAGDYGNDFVHIPGMQSYYMFSKYNWAYTSLPQENACQGRVNHQCAYPKGKGVGGSTLINGLTYSRGNREDYNKWANLTGDQRWSYKNVLPYFKKSENFSLWKSPYHGRNGPHHVEYSHPFNLYERMFISANKELGRPVVDFNGKEQLGVARDQYNTLHGTRHDTGTAFLLPVIHRDNLEVKTKSYATKILIDKESMTAKGVYFMHGGRKYLAKARKEVILCAGSMSTPQLLMLSGIGPKEHLKALEIPVLLDLPVGEHMLEHPGFYDLNFILDYSEKPKTVRQNIEEFVKGYGKYTITSTTCGITYERADRKRTGRPDYELAIAIVNGTNYRTQKLSRFTNETYNGLYRTLEDNEFVQMHLFWLHPLSRGTIKLKSSSPYDYPLIDPKLLSDDEGVDIEMMYKAVQIVLEMFEAEAFQAHKATLVPPQLPACAELVQFSKEYWYCVLKQLVKDSDHTVGTAKIGRSPEDSVVDSQLRVHGMRKLRVVDASIFPSLISGHISAPTEMVAEVAADIIIGDAQE